MTRLAIADNPDFAISTIEVDRPGPSYTVDTLRALRLEDPDAKIYFITGADAVAEVESWHEPEEVLRLARIIALTRPGFCFKAITSQLSEETLSRVDFIETLGIDLSASEMRDRVREGLPIRYLTPDPVVEYIASHRLYSKGGTSPESE
jgi:nicotinate-nucleotide adenylyltransferase